MTARFVTKLRNTEGKLVDLVLERDAVAKLHLALSRFLFYDDPFVAHDLDIRESLEVPGTVSLTFITKSGDDVMIHLPGWLASLLSTDHVRNTAIIAISRHALASHEDGDDETFDDAVSEINHMNSPELRDEAKELASTTSQRSKYAFKALKRVCEGERVMVEGLHFSTKSINWKKGLAASTGGAIQPELPCEHEEIGQAVIDALTESLRIVRDAMIEDTEGAEA